jgi:hypothetical protein
MRTLITFFELAALIASLIAWPRIRKSPYLRLFPFLLLVIAGVEIHQAYFFDHTAMNNAAIYNVQVPVQYVLYLSILALSLSTRRYRFFVWSMLFLFSVLTVVSLIWLTAAGQFNVHSYCVGSLFIIIGILLSFYEMLQNPSGFNFLKNPFFYILFVYLLYNVGTLPYFVMTQWLFIQDRPEISKIFVHVMSVFNYLVYTVYTLAFIWIALKKEFS